MSVTIQYNHTEAESAEILDRIAQAVETACHVSVEEMRTKRRCKEIFIARGIFLLMARKMYVHVRRTCKYLQRSRCNCIILTDRYKTMYFSGDKLIRRLFNCAVEEYDRLYELDN